MDQAVDHGDRELHQWVGSGSGRHHLRHGAVGRKETRPMTTGHVRTAPTLVSSRRIAALGLLASFLALLVTPARAAAGTPERVSVDSAGNEGNGGSGGPAISADGRFVAFASYASNLVPGDTNGVADVFVHDRQTGITERVSVDSAGNEGNGGSSGPAISADGRFVAFASSASNLVPGDTNGVADVFVHDRQTGTTERVSVDSLGNEGNGSSANPSISADGRVRKRAAGGSGVVAGGTTGRTD